MRKKLIRCASVFLALILCFGCLLIVSPAHAFVLDPVAWLYPVWVAYGQQAGVTVSTMGGDEFTQTGFTGLYNEWQQFEVNSGNQAAMQTIGDFVNGVVDFVHVAAGAISGGTLWSKLQLASGITEQLARFWNWVIVDKLGGSSVDSVDFSQVNGNVAISSGAGVLLTTSPIFLGSASSRRFEAYSNTDFPIYSCWSEDGASWHVYGPLYISESYFDIYPYGTNTNAYHGVFQTPNTVNVRASYDGSTQLYYAASYWDRPDYGAASGVPSYSSIRLALDSFSAYLSGGSSDGSITVAPDAGVDVLGFPDVSDPEYVPTDTNIDWNIPYDGTLDVPGYLDTAYDMTLDGTLTDTDVTEAPPVSGSGTVGNVGEYVAPGLGSVFPFCIPFDIYNFLSALAADPEAPCFTATLALPDAIGGAQTIELDLDNPTFNQLASLLRLLELLAFCVGLAFVTRSMFIRG